MRNLTDEVRHKFAHDIANLLAKTELTILEAITLLGEVYANAAFNQGLPFESFNALTKDLVTQCKENAKKQDK